MPGLGDPLVSDSIHLESSHSSRRDLEGQSRKGPSDLSLLLLVLTSAAFFLERVLSRGGEYHNTCAAVAWELCVGTSFPRGRLAT
jgi:hypothetical protein